MSIWILADLILVAFTAFMCCRSMKKGFLKSSYAGAASFAAIVLVFTMHTPFEGYIENSAIGDTVREKIRVSVETSLYANDATGEESVEAATGKMNLPSFMFDWIDNAIKTQKQSLNEVKQNMADSITEMIFPYVMQILSVVLLYILIRLMIWLIFVVLRLIFEIPILGKADKLLGALLGGINAVLIIYGVSALLMLLTPLASADALEMGINSTYLYKYFYYNNIITTMLFG